MKLIILFCSFAIISCKATVPVEKYNEDIRLLQQNNTKLKNDMNSTDVKISNLSNKLLILEAKISELQKTLQNGPQIKVASEIKETVKVDLKKEVEEYIVTDTKDEEPIVLTNSMLTSKKNSNDKSEDTKDLKIKKYSNEKIKSMYDNALNLFREKKHSESIEIFDELISLHKKRKSSLNDNFHYWIGENYLSLNDIPLARKHFTEVIQKYPNENKVPDCLFKLGNILELESKKNEAIELYNKIIKDYPDTEASKLSIKQLEVIQ